MNSETLLRDLDRNVESKAGSAHNEPLRELNDVLHAWVCSVTVRHGLYPNTDAVVQAVH